ncbi:hypothetical protein AYI69_g10682 [Smittium culicis]|uniref:Uncharacterized protein n=1 Tax=Smittium culicis TaxID=133412 RepID=A0A1R1X451_9FUNG|nr:hypothetical protein AYI69_g10682 [Smittium culicis]
MIYIESKSENLGTPFLDSFESGSPKFEGFYQYSGENYPLSPYSNAYSHASPDTLLSGSSYSDECFDFGAYSEDESQVSACTQRVSLSSKCSYEFRDDITTNFFSNYDKFDQLSPLISPTIPSSFCASDSFPVPNPAITSNGGDNCSIPRSSTSIDSILPKLKKFKYLKSIGLASPPLCDPIYPPGLDEYTRYKKKPSKSHNSRRNTFSHYTKDQPATFNNRAPTSTPSKKPYNSRRNSYANNPSKYTDNSGNPTNLPGISAFSSQKSPVRIPAIMFNLHGANKAKGDKNTNKSVDPKSQQNALKSLNDMIESIKTIHYPNKKYAR